MENLQEDTQQKKDEQFMRKALAEAEAAREAGEIPIGAVITCRDRIIARAHNLTETLNDVTAHAEMQAITAAADEKRGFTRFAPDALHPKATVTPGVLEEDCRRMMQDFFKAKR